MLVLSRRLHEKIFFPGIKAAVQVVAVKQGVVRLGIEAPGNVPVFREEVLDPAALQELSAAQQGERSADTLLRELCQQLNESA